MTDCDVAVIGAGVAGSVCAGLLGRSGYRVLLVDKATFPRTKICGEGLMPAGRRLLENLGLAEALTEAGARSFSALRFHLPNQRILELDFSEYPAAPLGCVLARETLDHLLVRFAASQKGVELREGRRLRRARFRRHRVELEIQNADRREVIRARAVVAADGIRSRFRAPGGIRCLSRGSHRFALRRLHDNYAAGARAVDVYCSQEAEAYVAPLSDGRARITLLTDKRVLPRSEGAEHLYENLLARFPEIMERIKTGGHHSQVETTSPVSARFSQCHGDRLILAGDAAGAVDPVTGTGNDDRTSRRPPGRTGSRARFENESTHGGCTPVLQQLPGALFPACLPSLAKTSHLTPLSLAVGTCPAGPEPLDRVEKKGDRSGRQSQPRS